MSVYTESDCIALYCNDQDRAIKRRQAIANLWGGMFKAYIVPVTSTAVTVRTLRSVINPDTQKPMRVFALAKFDGGDSFTAAQAISDAIARSGVGASDLDCENPKDSELASDMEGLIDALRNKVKVIDAQGRPVIDPATGSQQIGRKSFLFRLTVAPRKAGFLPIKRLQEDPNLFGNIFSYYGNMEMYNPAQAVKDLIAAGVPEYKLSLYLGAAANCRAEQPDGTFKDQRVFALPTVWYEGHFSGNWLTDGESVWDDDLLGDFGLLPPA